MGGRLDLDGGWEWVREAKRPWGSARSGAEAGATTGRTGLRKKERKHHTRRRFGMRRTRTLLARERVVRVDETRTRLALCSAVERLFRRVS